jgi:hypothetical protein
MLLCACDFISEPVTDHGPNDREDRSRISLLAKDPPMRKRLVVLGNASTVWPPCVPALSNGLGCVVLSGAELQSREQNVITRATLRAKHRSAKIIAQF